MTAQPLRLINRTAKAKNKAVRFFSIIIPFLKNQHNSAFFVIIRDLTIFNITRSAYEVYCFFHIKTGAAAAKGQACACYYYILFDFNNPAEFILDFPGLYSGYRVIKLLAHLADSAVSDIHNLIAEAQAADR